MRIRILGAANKFNPASLELVDVLRFLSQQSYDNVIDREWLLTEVDVHTYPSAGIRNPQSAIRNPQSAIRNPQSAIRNPQWMIISDRTPQSQVTVPALALENRRYL